jgi:hypothetical protein
MTTVSLAAWTLPNPNARNNTLTSSTYFFIPFSFKTVNMFFTPVDSLFLAHSGERFPDAQRQRLTHTIHELEPPSPPFGVLKVQCFPVVMI